MGTLLVESLVMIVADRRNSPNTIVLKCSGGAFRVHLTGCLGKMEYWLCPTDPDLWLKEQTDWKGSCYYASILYYVDNLLVVHHNPR